MGWYDSTNALAGIVQVSQQKKRDQWQKLMDIASLGSNIWEILSGRKYQTKEREAGQEYGTGERIAGQEFRTGERLGSEAHDTSMANLEAELREEQAGRDFPRELKLRQVSAGGEAAGRANDLLDLTEKIKGTLKNSYWSVYVDPESQTERIKHHKSPEEYQGAFSNLLIGAGLAEGSDQYARAMKILMDWVANPTVPGGDGGTPRVEPVDMNQALQELLARLTPQIQSYLNSLTPQEAEELAAGATGSVAGLLKPGGRNWVITPEAAGTLPRKSQYGVEDEERKMANALSSYIPYATPDERQDITTAIEALKPKGVLEWEPWKLIYALNEKLKKMYGSAKPRRPGE